ncbi:MAG: Uncharacterised protein [Marine Group II euryarchaeote MED-G33]|nr:MAG: Uncharacterised protein [Marine Group II euryarchaeote MED-G33]
MKSLQNILNGRGVKEREEDPPGHPFCVFDNQFASSEAVSMVAAYQTIMPNAVLLTKSAML